MFKWLEKNTLRLIRTRKVPKHIAFIMDGNRRWATRSGMKKHQGHSYGLEKLLEVIDWCLELGIGIISVFAFSTDNFNRNEEEVAELMSLFLKACKKLSDEGNIIQKRGVRIKIIGDLTGFPLQQQKALRQLEADTEKNKICVLNICLGYGSVEEIINAIEKVRIKVSDGLLRPEEITRRTLEDELMIQEPVDLMVRTGESRLSNFMLYQSCENTKFKMVTSIMWPDLKVWHMAYIIFSYQFLL
jgi:ditrans,polycis-polyprenyl diphosphate synthase